MRSGCVPTGLGPNRYSCPTKMQISTFHFDARVELNNCSGQMVALIRAACGDLGKRRM